MTVKEKALKERENLENKLNSISAIINSNKNMSLDYIMDKVKESSLLKSKLDMLNKILS